MTNLEGMTSTLVNQLQKQQTLSAKQAIAISTAMDMDDAVEALCSEAFRALDEADQDMLCSALFTPDSADRQEIEPYLSRQGLNCQEEEDLVESIFNKAPVCPLVCGDTTLPFSVPEIAVERFLRLMRWRASLSDALVQAINAVTADGASRMVLRTLLRERVWSRAGTGEMATQYLGVMAEKGSFSMEKMRFLSEWLMANRPHDLEELAEHLHNLQRAYDEDAQHPIFNTRLEDGQGVSIRSKYCGEKVRAYRLSMAQSILDDLQNSA
ncbi:MAG: hypothetical protein HQL50_06120 [Magnetococcales bacterium]|nr:hypothetical protein [Magnetococcales bacterium]